MSVDYLNENANIKDFHIGQTVWVKYFNFGDFKKGTIIKLLYQPEWGGGGGADVRFEDGTRLTGVAARDDAVSVQFLHTKPPKKKVFLVDILIRGTVENPFVLDELSGSMKSSAQFNGVKVESVEVRKEGSLYVD